MDQAPYIASSGERKENGLEKKSGKTSDLTPMMAQFFEIKAVNPGYLLFYRMGDFYELFFEDAEIAAGALGIALTTRGSHMGEPIPMCGVPVRAHQDYLSKLISLGHRVAICEQMEDPAEAKKRGSKSVVRRDVVRLVTPGTITEDELLPAGANNFLGALAMLRHGEADFALAWADISTGETFVSDLGAGELANELGRLDLAELILSEATDRFVREHGIIPEGVVRHQAILEPDLFQSERAGDVLDDAFEGFNPLSLSRTSRSALGALVAYVARTQKSAGTALRAPVSDPKSRAMQIDLATWTSLEVLSTNRGETRGSLRHAIDHTVTGAGSRLLARRLTRPLACPDTINLRLDMVQALHEDSLLRQQLADALKGMPDLTRPLTRLSLGRGGPRDLAHIARAVQGAKQVLEVLGQDSDLPEGLAGICRNLARAPADLAGEILDTLVDQPPLSFRDGGFVREGADDELDSQRELASQSRSVISALQARLADQTQIKSLKIKHNKVLGYFIEVPAAHGKTLLQDSMAATFIHRQTLANAMRFVTAELSDLESRIARAQQVALEIETGIFDRLHARVLEQADALREAADGLAETDLTLGLACLAAKRAYCRPRVDNSMKFDIRGGRHPVVEQTLAAANETFVTNDCDLSGMGEGEKEGGQLWLVTGPNMGGKSTFLRQNALIALLAQIGSFVPADSAEIGVVDRLFSRVGASDDIARGRSTFMVEMVETAAILNRATRRSLVILDEIGRGTATFDGLSLAWATAEALHQSNGSRALFATHFHELTSLPNILERVSNHTMKAREWQGEVVFLHEVGKGAADRSYGIQVARLAGLPEPVLARAREILTVLENDAARAPARMLDDLPLFSLSPPPEPAQTDPVLERIDELVPDELTPRQAIDLIYELKRLRRQSRNGRS